MSGITRSIGYTEVEAEQPDKIRLACECGQVIQKRKDSFVPGLHTVQCLACGNVSTEVTLLGGETREQSAEDHRSAA